MRKLMTTDIASYLGIKTKVCMPIQMYALDSRLVGPGCVFFALKGQKVDGHAYVAEAKKRGAIVAIVEQKVDVIGIEQWIVEDVRASLQGLAQWVYGQKKCRVIGVTGSVGKTTTKECIAQGLGKAFKVGYSPGSYNSQVTLPLAVLNCPADADVCVLEYAMSEKGQLKRLVEIAPPDIGVITPIDYVHAENFNSLEEIAQEKAQLFRSPSMVQGFVHYRAWEWVGAIGHFPKTRYGKDALGPFASKALNENYQAAVAVGRYLGVPALAEVAPIKRRFEIVEKNALMFVNDSYNANVLSFKAAMENLPPGKRKIGVFGSMGELGAFSQKCHEEVVAAAKGVFDQVLYVGEEWKGCIKAATVFDHFDNLKEAFLKTVKPGDVVLLKGSNRHQLWRLVEEL